VIRFPQLYPFTIGGYVFVDIHHNHKNYSAYSAPLVRAMSSACWRELVASCTACSSSPWLQIARQQVELLGDDVVTVLTHAAYHQAAAGPGAAGFQVCRTRSASP
jgi:hypothetical protein